MPDVPAFDDPLPSPPASPGGLSRRPGVLLVDDDVNVLMSLRSLLGQRFELRAARGGAEAWRLAHLEPPDLVLLDIEMPDIDGLTLCRRIKADPLLAGVPVIFLSSHCDEAHELQGLLAGASDFITKPPRGPVVAARVDNLVRTKRLTERLRLEATTDGLTGLGNRRQFDLVLQAEWRRSVRQGTPLALMMLDVDHFKAYNDHHGHVAGDGCLRAVAAALRTALHRPADQAFRYGGEEFALLLPSTDAAGAARVAAAVRAALCAARLAHGASPVSPLVTLSGGVSAIEPGGAGWLPWSQLTPDRELAHAVPPTQLLQAADAALYAAKAAGRDGVAVLPIEQAAHPEQAQLLWPATAPATTTSTTTTTARPVQPACQP